MQDLHNITAGSAFLIVARSVLQNITTTECLTITAGFNQVKGLNTLTRVVLIVSSTDVFFQFFEDSVFIVFETLTVDSDVNVTCNRCCLLYTSDAADE